MTIQPAGSIPADGIYDLRNGLSREVLNQIDVKSDKVTSDARLQEAINNMSFWGSATGIEIDEIIDEQPVRGK